MRPKPLFKVDLSLERSDGDMYDEDVVRRSEAGVAPEVVVRRERDAQAPAAA